MDGKLDKKKIVKNLLSFHHFHENRKKQNDLMDLVNFISGSLFSYVHIYTRMYIYSEKSNKYNVRISGPQVLWQILVYTSYIYTQKATK